MKPVEPTRVRATARYTTTQVAEVLGVNRSSVRRWADAKMLRSHRGMGGRRWFLGSDIQHFIFTKL